MREVFSKFSAMYEGATSRGQGTKRQELYRLPTASSGLDPTYPAATSLPLTYPLG
jgi:hypothetical protein